MPDAPYTSKALSPKNRRPLQATLVKCESLILHILKLYTEKLTLLKILLRVRKKKSTVQINFNELISNKNIEEKEEFQNKNTCLAYQQQYL